jgi:hypothetical protein
MGGNHHFCKLPMHRLENLGIFGQLLPYILGADKYINQNPPIFLHLQPLIDNNIDPSQLLPPIFDNRNKKLNVLTLGLHTHQIQRISVKNLHHVVERSKYVVLLVIVESKQLLRPVTLDYF